jgi:DNA repair protein RadC
MDIYHKCENSLIKKELMAICTVAHKTILLCIVIKCAVANGVEAKATVHYHPSDYTTSSNEVKHL